jgi:hypothetical protein
MKNKVTNKNKNKNKNKITAGPKKPIPTGEVFVVSGIVYYEGRDIVAVTTSRKLANLAIQADKAARIASQHFVYDSYAVQSFGLDTVVTVTSFGTGRKVARL